MRTYLRRLWAAVRVGWAVESNWTRTWVFVLYSAVRPLAACLVLFFLFRLVYDRPGGQQAFVGVYTANAFYTLVIALAAGATWVVINDREHYYIIRYIYVSPIRLASYIVGRSLPLLVLGVSSLVLILLFGRFALHMPLGPATVRWGMLLPSLVLGLLASMALGLIFAGFCLITAKHSMMLAEGAGSVFLLLCGVIFPVDILPAALRLAGLALPVTYWMEAVRRSFGVYDFSAVLAHTSDVSLLLIQLISSVVLAALAWWGFHACERFAVSRGKLDQATNY